MIYLTIYFIGSNYIYSGILWKKRKKTERKEIGRENGREMARYLWLKVYGWNKNVLKDIKLDHKNVVVGFFVLTFAKSEEFLFCDGTINYAKTFFYQK